MSRKIRQMSSALASRVYLIVGVEFVTGPVMELVPVFLCFVNVFISGRNTLNKFLEGDLNLGKVSDGGLFVKGSHFPCQILPVFSGYSPF